MIDNRDKVNAVIEHSDTPSNVRSTLQDLLAVDDYLSSVDVDDDGNVTPKENPGQDELGTDSNAPQGSGDATGEVGPTGDGEASSPAPGDGGSSPHSDG